MLKALIAATKADGHVDERERSGRVAGAVDGEAASINEDRAPVLTPIEPRAAKH